MKDLEKRIQELEIENANIKINYIGSLIVVVSYLFFDKYGTVSIFGMNLNSTAMACIIALVTVLFLWKESFLYGKHLIKKVIFKGRK